MVDAAAPVEAADPVADPDAAADLDIAVYRQPEAARLAYALAASGAVMAPPQSAGWVAAWLAESAVDCLVAVLAKRGTPVLALALEVVREGPCRVARFMGGRHANGNFPALKARSAVTAGDLAALVAAIRHAAP